MTWRVIQAVYLKHGVRGFYKGYFTSLLVYTPHSAMWWTLYDKYCGKQKKKKKIVVEIPSLIILTVIIMLITLV